MSIRKNISLMLCRYKAEHQLSLVKMSELLDIPASSLQCYLKAQIDLRADTIELLAAKTGMSVTELVSGPAPEWKRAEVMVWAGREISGLPAGRQEQGVELFLQLVSLFAGDT